MICAGCHNPDRRLPLTRPLWPSRRRNWQSKFTSRRLQATYRLLQPLCSGMLVERLHASPKLPQNALEHGAKKRRPPKRRNGGPKGRNLLPRGTWAPQNETNQQVVWGALRGPRVPTEAPKLCPNPQKNIKSIQKVQKRDPRAARIPFLSGANGLLSLSL